MAELAEQRSLPRTLKPEELFLERALSLQLDPEYGILKPVEVVGRKGEFKSHDIFRAYVDRLDRQADVLEHSVGTKRRSAVLKDVERASKDLDDAEQAADTTPDTILQDVTVADLVRHQEAVRNYKLISLHPWYSKEYVESRETKEEREETARRVKGLMVNLLTAVLEFKLLTPFEFLKAIGFLLLTSRLVPEETLQRLLEMAVTMGEGNKPFKASHFLGVFKVELLVDCLELEELYRVILAVVEKYKWLPEKPKELPADTDDEDRATR